MVIAAKKFAKQRVNVRQYIGDPAEAEMDRTHAAEVGRAAKTIYIRPWPEV
jgi:hypothetical protein